jgi:Holliday junction resolvasome RuvABC endonuclease subunit
VAAKAPAGQGFPNTNEIRANPVVLPQTKSKRKVPIELALDLSSSCVGWALGVDRSLAKWGKFVFKSTAGTGEKLDSFEEFLQVLLSVYKPERLLIERPSTKGKTRERHTEIMGIVRKVWFEHSGGELVESWIQSPRTIKNVMKVERGQNHKQNKEIMVRKINSLYSNILHLRFHENSKLQSDDDIADAIAVLVTYWRRNSRTKSTT